MDRPANPAVALLEFERRIRSASSNREVAFRAVNETTAALAFDQAILWRIDALSRPMVVAASGLADVTVDSPYQQWLAKLIRGTVHEPFRAPQAKALADLPEGLAAEGEEWCRAHLLLCPLTGPDGNPQGGMIFMRGTAFGEADVAVAEWIAQTTGFGLWAWRKDQPRLRRWMKGRNRALLAGGLVAAAVLLGVIPVRLTALAPAEISPLKPIPVTAPVDAVVNKVLVKPNEEVKAGQILAILDDTTVRNRLAVAEKALEIARADLQRVVYKSFSDEASRLELQVLEARVREKAAEVSHLSEVLGRLTLTAPQGGIAIFSDADDWAGKPVQVGQRVMVIADPSLVDVTAYLAPEDAVELESGSEVTMYLHVSPLAPLSATISRSSYEALPGPDGKLAYLVRAELASGQELPRIGLRGTAKISAGRVSLAFYLFRKPLAFLRRAAGF
ncbi:MAG: HlyD family efflux transporter periplasmic adaptor subunit [Betaproteobacteria bacterium]